MAEETKFVNTSGWSQEEIDALDALVIELKTDRSKLIRQIVAEKAQEYTHLNGVRRRIVEPRIRQVSRS